MTEPNDIFEHHYIGHNLMLARCIDVVPRMHYRALWNWQGSISHPDPVCCPACLSSDVWGIDNKHTDCEDRPDWWCNNCGMVWKWLQGACLACGVFLYRQDDGRLWCSWCGQVWDEEVILNAYRIGDELGEVDFGTKKGANSGSTQ